MLRAVPHDEEEAGRWLPPPRYRSATASQPLYSVAGLGGVGKQAPADDADPPVCIAAGVLRGKSVGDGKRLDDAVGVADRSEAFGGGQHAVEGLLVPSAEEGDPPDLEPR